MTLGTFGLLRIGEFALDEAEPLSSLRLLRVGAVQFEQTDRGALMRVLLRTSEADRARKDLTVKPNEELRAPFLVVTRSRKTLLGTTQNDGESGEKVKNNRRTRT